MYLKHKNIGILAATLLATLLSACKTDQKQPEPVAVAPRETPKAESPAQGSLTPAGVPDGLSLFGDRPDYEIVPYENRLITNLVRHSDTTEGLDFDPDICNLDDTLAYSSTRNSARPDIFLKKADGATITQLTADPADDVHPRFSPDGLQVVFCSNRTSNWDIWLVNRDGTELIQLTSDLTDEVAPCWAPDGTRIAFTIWGQRSRQWEIWTLNVDNPATRKFLVYGMFPTWSPDGKKLAFQRARQRGSRLFSVWTIDLTAGEARHPTEIAHSDVDACIAPRWSPDGSAIVYCAVREVLVARTPASRMPPPRRTCGSSSSEQACA